MKFSKFTKFVVAFCAFFIGAIPASFFIEKAMNPGKTYPYVNPNILFDGWDKIPTEIGLTILVGVVCSIISMLILNKVQRKK